MQLLPHLWTIVPRMQHALRPLRSPPAARWSTVLDDARVGPVRVTGWLDELPTSDEMLVLIHGLGGSASSHYLLRAALVARAARLSTLRLNLRGADLSGDDFYHAGLTADLEAALNSSALERYRRIYVVGFSLGGHAALHLATRPTDPRLRAAAAICSPLDLSACSHEIDSPPAWLYRRYLLASLVRVYRPVAARRAVPVSVGTAARIRRLREWDDRIVAPHHGFLGVDDYHARASVGPRLSQIKLPALLVSAVGDPMIPDATIRAPIADASPLLTVRRVARGGHVTFPTDLDLGFGDERGLIAQTLSWLRRQ
jgi:predicted alpha/beta-fold hydrolase